MLKYMLTIKCNKNCSYCITRKVKIKESGDLIKLVKVLSKERQKQDSIMLTGGEPTLAKLFKEKVFACSLLFSHMYLTTQNSWILNEKDFLERYFDAITFSLHQDYIPLIKINIPVYASIVDFKYYRDLPHRLKICGFSGLTINEEQREGKKFTKRLPKLDNFSIKVNRRGNCIYETIILPNLEVINDFRPYL